MEHSPHTTPHRATRPSLIARLHSSAHATMPGGMVTFQPSWLRKVDWIKSVVADKYSAYCTLCKKKFSVRTMGFNAVKSHANGKKHLELVSSKQTVTGVEKFISPGKDSTDLAGSSETSVRALPSRCSGRCVCCAKTGKTFSTAEQELRAEVMWVPRAPSQGQ